MESVFVSGANGHLGFNLVKLLSDRGYYVKAGVRDITNDKKSEHLSNLKNVEIVQADIMNLDQMILASEGVQGIFHVAAVFAFNIKDPENSIIKPAIEGTLNALRAAKRNKVQKVVLTSSTVALGNSSTKTDPLDENSWNTSTKVPYAIGKYRSEKEAWDYAKENNINLVTVNPGLILGPDIYRITPSVELIINIMNNKFPLIPPLSFNPVDVRDVAEAQIMVYENKETNGRYIAATTSYSVGDFIDICKAYYNDIKKPRFTMKRSFFLFYVYLNYYTNRLFRRTPLLSPQQAKEYSEGAFYTDTTRLRDLGWRARPIEETIKDTLDWLSTHNI